MVRQDTSGRSGAGAGAGTMTRGWRSDQQGGGAQGGPMQRGQRGSMQGQARGGQGQYGGGQGQFAGVGPRDYQRSPDLIGDEVVVVLTADPDIDASDITVLVDPDGTVTLIGIVDTDEDAQRAGDLAGSVPGVTDLRNQLGTAQGGDTGNRGAAGRQQRGAGAGRAGGGYSSR